MDTLDFDRITSSFSRTRGRRGALHALVATTFGIGGVTLLGGEVVAAKKKKRKKSRCRIVEESCGGKKEKCCDGLACDTVGDSVGKTCCKNAGQACPSGDPAECCRDLHCCGGVCTEPI